MKISITARKFKARDELKTYIESEVESLGKYFDGILDVEVILSFQHQKDSIKNAEIIAKVPGQVLTSKNDAADFELAVRGAVEKIGRQLQKLKEKRNEFTPIPPVPDDTDQQ